MSDYRLAVIIAIVCYVTAVIALWIGFYMRSKLKRLLDHSLRAEGRIVSFEEGVTTSSEVLTKAFYPVFVFKDSEGKEYRVRSSIGRNRDAHFVGERVDVAYRPEAPEEAIMDVNTWINVPRICFCVAGTAFLFGTMAIIFLS